ncbi:MAG: hypothetical protein LBS03_04820 [Bacteroidales bacterium]|jgi:hypothetical protein|nr:hypothetical protein [Bacteroidales bacterium]
MEDRFNSDRLTVQVVVFVLFALYEKERPDNKNANKRKPAATTQPFIKVCLTNACGYRWTPNGYPTQELSNGELSHLFNHDGYFFWKGENTVKKNLLSL